MCEASVTNAEPSEDNSISVVKVSEIVDECTQDIQYCWSVGDFNCLNRVFFHSVHDFS